MKGAVDVLWPYDSNHAMGLSPTFSSWHPAVAWCLFCRRSTAGTLPLHTDLTMQHSWVMGSLYAHTGRQAGPL